MTIASKDAAAIGRAIWAERVGSRAPYRIGGRPPVW